MLVDVLPELDTEAPDGIGMALRDGYEIHRAALRHGLDVVLFPRQVLTTRHPGNGSELAFVHGIPASSSQSAVTYAQDKQMRRELLTSAGLPVPEGASFAIGREIDDAKQFADRIGYPVVVKPRLGDNMVEVLPGIRNEKQLDAAINYLRTPPARRPRFTRAAYAITLLSEPMEDDGQTFVPAGYRFLVERHVSGTYLRLLVVDDRVVSAIHAPAGLAHSDEPCRDVTGEVHPSVLEFGVRAVRAVSGLAIGAIDIVLADYHQPALEQELWIVEFSERPWLEMQARVSAALSHELGESVFVKYADELSVPLDPPREDATVEFQVRDATDADGAATAITAAAESLALTAQIDAVDHVDGTVAGVLEGSVDHIARIFELLAAGQLDHQRAMLIEVIHADRRESSRTTSQAGLEP